MADLVDEAALGQRTEPTSKSVRHARPHRGLPPPPRRRLAPPNRADLSRRTLRNAAGLHRSPHLMDGSARRDGCCARPTGPGPISASGGRHASRRKRPAMRLLARLHVYRWASRSTTPRRSMMAVLPYGDGMSWNYRAYPGLQQESPKTVRHTRPHRGRPRRPGRPGRPGAGYPCRTRPSCLAAHFVTPPAPPLTVPYGWLRTPRWRKRHR